MGGCANYKSRLVNDFIKKKSEPVVVVHASSGDGEESRSLSSRPACSI